MREWKLAYKLTLTHIVDSLRCSYTHKNFFEDVLGVGLDFTVNPKTRRVDYISLSQDLLSDTAWRAQKVRADTFGNELKLFLPLFFSEDHFQRALPALKKTFVRLCPDRSTTRFQPDMVLDVLPKMINTFIVLVADEGVAASRKSFEGMTRVHRLFLALCHQFPCIKTEAVRRLRLFASKEAQRSKAAVPSLGNLLPLLMICDQSQVSWRSVSSAYLSENFDRNVLWVCKAHPKLERPVVESAAEEEERLQLSLEAMTVSSRLLMFHVYVLQSLCKGTTENRANVYDRFFGQLEPEDGVESKEDSDGHLSNPASADGGKEQCQQPLAMAGMAQVKGAAPLSFAHFRGEVARILAVDTWPAFFAAVFISCPSKPALARLLRKSVANSRRRKYHREGMNFASVQSGGTSKLLAKGQQFTAQAGLRLVVFTDVWGFKADKGNKYLDATCLLYRGKQLAGSVDFSKTAFGGQAVVHSGDVMRHGGGTHTITLDLLALDQDITSCVFVISAYAGATLMDILSPSIAFTDADAGPGAEPLCTYDLDAHDKVSHLTAVVMCKLYRARQGGWHVLAIGDAHRGSASDYGPIHQAVQKLL